MAITEYYVSAAGGGAHDGTSEANAWTLSEAITANNALGAGGAAGRRYNIKGAHTARGATDTISVGGTATSPAIWRGYNSTIGDLDTGTRDAYGVLDTTNFPDIAYNSGFRLAVSGTYIVVANIDMSHNVSGAGFYVSGADCAVYNCRCVTTSTNAAATGAYSDSSQGMWTNCDFASAASGGSCAFGAGIVGFFHGCRATSPGATGFLVSQNSAFTFTSCTAYGCGSHGFAAGHASSFLRMFHCTSQGNTGNGADILSTNTRIHFIEGCSLTDNGGYAIDLNGGAAGARVRLAGNRYRDNTSGTLDATYDDTIATDFRAITTDAGGASTDYVDAATNKDFRLISTAAGYRQGFAYNANIGACGDNVAASSGVVGVIGS